MTSIIHALERGATAHPDRLAYSFLDVFGREKESYTYLAFQERTRCLARHLKETCGIRHGERTLLVYPPGLELVAALVACARIGAIPVPVYPPTPMNFAAGLAKLRFVARDCQASAALATRAFLRSYRLDLDKSANAVDPLAWITTDDVRGVAPAGFTDDPGPVLMLQYTSGSTSEPKGVVVSHDNVIENCAGTLDFVPTCVSWLPQYHDMGLIGYYLYPLIKGGTTYGFSSLDFLKRPALWFQTITRVGATHTGAPNFGYEYCLREDKLPEAELASFDLSTLRVMMNAAEPVRPKTHERFLRRFAACGLPADALGAAYGLAENTITVSQHGRRAVTVNKALLQRQVLHIEPARDGNNNQLALMSCGKPIEGVTASIVDCASGATLGEERIGEIRVSGPSTCRGYWNRLAADDDAFAGGILRTGDLGFFHDGELYVCGRIKDLIIVRGVNYYPQDVEAIVESCSPAIRQGGVAAFDAGDEGAGLVVLIEVKKTAVRPDPLAIARAIRTQYYIDPDTIAFVPQRSLPKTTSGKLARALAKRRFCDGELPVLESYVASRDPEAKAALTGARERFRYVLELYALTGDETMSFAEVGIDSLTTVELLADIKQLLTDHGAGGLVDEIDVRLLQRLTVADFFALIDRFGSTPDPSLTGVRAMLARLSEEQAAYERECMTADARFEALPFDAGARHGDPTGDVLLTGATGFFGPFLLRALLEQTGSTFHALVRATDERQGMDKIRAALRRAGLLAAPLSDALDRRVRVVSGDLGRHELGLRHETWNALAARVGSVIHNGALVHYVQSYDALRPANVDGTRELLRFAMTGLPKSFHFVSSTFIHGWSAKPILWETDDNAAMDNLDFGYAQSKWVAEQLVLAAGRNGLNVQVYRPSLISASSGGAGSADDIAVRLLAFMITHGLAPEAGNQLSFLPADVAAHNIAAIVAAAASSPVPLHVTVDEYYSMVDVTREISRTYGYAFAYLPIPKFVAEMNRRATRLDPIFPLLDFFNRSHPKISAMQRKRYNNDGYRAAREASGRGCADPTLAETVSYLMAFLLNEELIVPRRNDEETRRRRPSPARPLRRRPTRSVVSR